jgi:hypothetical protein
VSEYEQPGRLEREPTVEDVRQLMGASAPHFATHLRNRIESLVAGLPADHPARRLGEREISRLDQLALGSERRGTGGDEHPGMPSLRRDHVPESGTDTGAA